MYKELLEKQEPVVYHALKNAAENSRIGQAYLFTGPSGTPKYEAALLLAETIFCEKQEGLACEECDACRRVREGTYADLVVLDGRENAVSKDQVDALQEQFSKTALEKSGKRVYIIRNCENATVSAQNSMLKFLEEPGKDITAILTTDNESRVLPTILSRCTILPFVPVETAVFADAAKEAGVKEEDVYFVSHLAKDVQEISTFYESESYANALSMMKQFLNLQGLRRRELLVDYEVSWRSHDSDRDKAKKSDLRTLTAFFDLLNLYYHDALLQNRQGPSWYQEAVGNLKKSDAWCVRQIVILNEEKDQVNRFNDLNLLMDQAFFRLEENSHERG